MVGLKLEEMYFSRVSNVLKKCKCLRIYKQSLIDVS